MKAGLEGRPQFFAEVRGLPDLVRRAGSQRQPVTRVIYGGDATQERIDVSVVPWSGIPSVDWV